MGFMVITGVGKMIKGENIAFTLCPLCMKPGLIKSTYIPHPILEQNILSLPWGLFSS